MHIVQKILTEAKTYQWPYPKTFETLKKAGVLSYIVIFAKNQEYNATYITTENTFKEEIPKNYIPLKAAENFDGNKIRQAIIRHSKKETDFVHFLAEIAQAGATHYKVIMENRTVTYFNNDESKFHQEKVPFYQE
jgi:uncharacterized protein YbcV (DUF1398 family)